MKVIILQDIEKIGKRYEVKEVKDGYARNFLIPKGLVKPATKTLIEWAEAQKEIEKNRTEEELKVVQTMASQIDGLEVVIPVKTGKEGQLFESINSQKISEEIKKLNSAFEVSKSQIDLPKPIKELGEFPVKIKFEHNLEAEIKVITVNQAKP